MSTKENGSDHNIGQMYIQLLFIEFLYLLSDSLPYVICSAEAPQALEAIPRKDKIKYYIIDIGDLIHI